MTRAPLAQVVPIAVAAVLIWGWAWLQLRRLWRK